MNSLRLRPNAPALRRGVKVADRARALGGFGLGMILAGLVFTSLPSRAAEATNELERLKAQCQDLVMNRSRFQEARAVAEQLLALALKQHGEVHLETVVALHFTGYLAKEDGRYGEARQAWERSIAIQEQLPERDHLKFSRTLHMLAEIHREQGDLPGAELLLKHALDVRETALGGEHPEVAQILKNLGRVHELRGDYAQAEAFFLRALRQSEGGGPDYDPLTASILSMLGSIYAQLGDWDKAAPNFGRALRLNERRHGHEHASTAATMEKLAQVVYHQGNFATAESLRLQGIAIRERLNGTNYFGLFDPLVSLGELYLYEGQLDKAEGALHRSLELASGEIRDMELKRARPLFRLGTLYECKGDYAKAQEFTEQSLCLRERNHGPSQRSTYDTLRQLARLHFARGRPESALEVAGRIQDAEEHELASVLSFMSERQRLSYQQGSFTRHRFALWATLGAVEPLARAVIRTKGVVLDSLLEDRLLAEGSDDPETRQLVADLILVKQSLAACHSDRFRESDDGASTAEGTNELAALRQQLESMEGALARKVTAIGGARRALSVRVEQVQAAIPADAALLEFVRYRHYQGMGKSEDSYGVLLLSGCGQPRWFPLGPAGQIEKDIKRYQHAVRQPVGGVALDAILRALHKQLWEPFERTLPVEAKRVVICPDGPLNFVSFATLLTASNRFLGEQLLISYVSSSRDLLGEAKFPSAARQLLVWANPDFGATTTEPSGTNKIHLASRAASVRGLRDLNFQPLPGAEKEGRSLSARATDLGFSRAVLRVGKDATEAELNRVRSPDVLHFATHGFVLPEMEPSRTVSESRPDGERAAVWSKLVNPMLRCGLALAGARRSLDAWARGESVPSDNDGIVTAEEIAALDLRRTRLAVLSACDTGLGDAWAGEGVLGLRRGFIQAGAQNLLLTLWPIDDDKTAGFMAEFHEVAHRGGDFPNALAEVQARWLQSLREKLGATEACRIAGPFILSFQGRPEASGLMVGGQ